MRLFYFKKVSHISSYSPSIRAQERIKCIKLTVFFFFPAIQRKIAQDKLMRIQRVKAAKRFLEEQDSIRKETEVMSVASRRTKFSKNTLKRESTHLDPSLPLEMISPFALGVQEEAGLLSQDSLFGDFDLPPSGPDFSLFQEYINNSCSQAFLEATAKERKKKFGHFQVSISFSLIPSARLNLSFYP